MLDAPQNDYRISASRLKQFCDDALAWFDAQAFTFGSLINAQDVLDLVEFPLSNGYMDATEFRDRELMRLQILSAFKDVLLQHRSRCVKQEGAHLRVLHPAEQIEYGETRHTRIALQKLRKGQRIVSFTETDDVTMRNASIDRMKNIETMIRRQQEARRGIKE